MNLLRGRSRGRPGLSARDDRGAAAVEMAIVLPLLLLVLFGLVDFGRMYNTQMQLTQAAREAVRVMALGGTNDAVQMALVKNDAQNRVVAATGGLDPVPSAAFPQSCAAVDITSNAKVTVSYNFRFITPLGPIARLIGASSLPGAGDVKVLSADGVMRCSG